MTGGGEIPCSGGGGVVVVNFIVTDVRRGTSGTSRDVPIFVQFYKKNQNSYTLVVKNPKFVHFGGRIPKICTLWW